MVKWLVWIGLVSSAGATCPPAGYDLDALRALKAAQFEVRDAAARQSLALEMLDCLAERDPALRDGIAFEAESTWLRGDAIYLATRRALLATLARRLAAPDDADGFGKPFAALVLAEVARTDRIAPWLDPGERAALVETAARYVEDIVDHRGFVDGDGWRHGVAHGADLLMQLALNPALDKRALDRLLAAIAAQVRPAGTHAYVHGEPARLARPLLFVAQRGLHSEAEWQAWFAALARPTPLATWDDAFSRERGLAQRHNLVAFLQAVYVGANRSADASGKALLPAVGATLDALP